MVKVGIFGGMFNPFHNGHANSLVTVMKALGLDEIRVIPAWASPLKEIEKKPTPLERLKMVAESLKDLGPEFIVDDIEIKRKGPSYTIDTLNALIKKGNKKEYYLIIGMDQFEKFDQWKDYQKILDKVHLVVTSRQNQPIPSSRKRLPAALSEMILSGAKTKYSLSTGKKLIFVQLKDIDISSTEVRKRMAKGMEISELIPSNEHKFIKDEGTYSFLQGGDAETKKLLDCCAKVLFSMKAFDVKAFDLSAQNQICDYSIIASGTSTRQAQAMAEKLILATKTELGVRPFQIEGLSEGRWVVVDYGSVMAHIFYDFTRQQYRLEEIWKDTPPIPLVEPKHPAEEREI